jgi:hypothetical protein
MPFLVAEELQTECSFLLRELAEREVTSPSHLKVVGALDNYSLVFVIFINFFGQLKD